MKLVNDKKLYNLDFELQFASSQSFMKKFNKVMRNSSIDTIKRIGFITIPFLVVLAIWALTQMDVFLIVALGVLFTTATINSISESKTEDQAYANPNATGIDPIVDAIRLLRKRKQRKRVEDYYTDRHKDLKGSKPSSEDIKYYHVVENQLEKNQDEEEVLGLEETSSQISEEMEAYYHLYKLPKSVITNEEWDVLFDSIFELFCKKGLVKHFYKHLSSFIRYSLANVLVLERTTLNMDDFVENLDYFEIITASEEEKVTKDDIKDLQNKISKHIKSHRVTDSRKKAEILDFNQHKSKKRG